MSLRLGLGLGLGMSRPVWSPTKLGTTLVQWNEPDSMTVATGHVTSWADKSTRGVTLAEATSPPTVGTLNGLNVATFEGRTLRKAA